MKEIYDIETLINCITICGLNIKTLEKSEFILHEDQNDLVKLYNHLDLLKGQIGFNNLVFDGQVIQYILENRKKFLNLHISQVITLIYEFAQKAIALANSGNWSIYPEWKLIIPQLDLLKIWHFDNKAKMTSLKWIEYMIDMHSIEEMPIHHSTPVTLKQVKEEIIPYNHYDVYATYQFFNITRGKTELPLYKEINKIELRQNINKEFGINCFNYNDVKIGDEINKISYCQLTGLTKKTLPKPSRKFPDILFKDCFPDYMEFKTDKFKNFIKLIENIKIDKDKKQEFELEYNGTIYLIAKGGLHSKDKGRLIQPLENEYLKDCDVGSMYPNAIRKRKLFPKHLGEKWLTGYVDIIEKRLIAKKKYKETKEGKYNAIGEAYKLSLNGGGFGKTNEENSWQYDPFVTFSVTIGSQIDLLMLIEQFEINNIHVISANTDGLVCLFDKSLIDTYNKVCKEWEIKVGNDVLGQLEYTDYKLFAQTSVNDYIAIKTDGEVKTKGDFVSDYELHKNKSARIVPLAIQQWFINNIPVEKTIKECTNIFDFTLGVKSIGKNRLVSFNKQTQEEIELQKINRYYISNKGIYLLKRLPKLDSKIASYQLDIFGNVDDGERESKVEASSLQTIYNKHIKKDISEYNINYQYYIDRCYTILNKIEK